MTSDPEIMGGEPVFTGTRVPVRTLADYLAAGEALEEFLEQFPTVSREHALVVMEESRFQELLRYERERPLFAVPRSLLGANEPAAAACIDAWRALIDESMLREISQADYGMHAEAHYAALLPIWKEGRVPAPIEWEPLEVLSLIQWSVPEDPEWKPGAEGRRGHIERGFCCAALLLAGADPRNSGYMSGANQTLIQLLDSSLKLGPPLPGALGRSLVWRLGNSADPIHERREELLSFVLGLLFLLALDPGSRLEESDLASACEWLGSAEQRLRQDFGAELPGGDRWLFGLTQFNLCEARWKEVALRVVHDGASPSVKALAELVLRDEIATRD